MFLGIIKVEARDVLTMFLGFGHFSYKLSSFGRTCNSRLRIDGPKPGADLGFKTP